MKRLFATFTLLLGFISAGFAQSEYDEALAQKVGADEYGMKKYVLAFLLRGDRVDEYTPEQRQEIQGAHMENIGKIAEMGKLVVAGPFFGNEDLRGLYIFDVQTLDEAKALTETDPAIQKGVLKMDLKEWYGSAALVLLADLYPKVTKKNF
jgi:uncharacterized protein YciI